MDDAWIAEFAEAREICIVFSTFSLERTPRVRYTAPLGSDASDPRGALFLFRVPKPVLAVGKSVNVAIPGRQKCQGVSSANPCWVCVESALFLAVLGTWVKRCRTTCNAL